MAKINNRVFLIIIVLLTILGGYYGITVKSSFVDNTVVMNEINDGSNRILKIVGSDEFVNSYFNNKIKNENELYENSELVVAVKLNGDRTNFSQSILSEVEVLDIINNRNNYDIGNKIFVYEPNNFMYRSKYYSLGGYNIMENEKEYILYLEKLIQPDDYTSKTNKLIFKPVSTKFSKFEINNTNTPVIMIKEDVDAGLYSYDNIRNYEVIFTKKTDISLFNKIKRDALKRLN